MEGKQGYMLWFYLGEIDNDHEIFKPNGGSFSPTEVFVHDPRPATSEGSYSTTSGYSVDLEVISGLILLDQVLDLVQEAQYPKAIQ